MSKLLTPKQRAFVREYLVDFNATQAARRAGYQGDENSLAVIGSRNIRNPQVQKTVNKYLVENSMGLEEVLYRLTRQARASLGDLMSTTEDGKFVFDFKKGFETGAIDMVEKFYVYASNSPEGIQCRLHIKVYSAQKALIQLGKAYGLWRGDLPQILPQELGEWDPGSSGFDKVSENCENVDPIVSATQPELPYPLGDRPDQQDGVDTEIESSSGELNK